MKTPAIWKKTAAVLAAACLVLGLAGCGSDEGESISSGREAYQDYVIGIMDANYLGQYDSYMQLTGAGEEEAQSIYNANIQDFAVSIEEAFSIESDVVSQTIKDRVSQMAVTIYSQTKYQAVDVIRDGDIYTVTVEIEPIDFFGTVQDQFSAAVDAFNTRAKDGEFDESSDAEYEEAYAQAVLDAVESLVSSVSYDSAVQVDITLDYDAENNLYTISDEQMEALDSRVVNMSR